MEKIVEKIEKAEEEAAKLIAQAEADCRKALSDKQREIEQKRLIMQNEAKEIIEYARQLGIEDAKARIAELKTEEENLKKSFMEEYKLLMQELMEIVIKEL